MSQITYNVFMTPLTTEDVYGAEVEISDFVLDAGVSKIKNGIDSTDYDFGLFKYGDINLKCQNKNGILNDETDSRSIFTFSRDRAKVRVIFRQTADSDTAGTTQTDTLTFNGLINEEATRLSLINDTINFKVLSFDSVIRNTKVSGGTVASGVSVSSAIKSILNVPRITSVLTFDASKINPDIDEIIDVGSEFDNLTTRTALNKLLLAGNSVFLIDSTNTMIVKSREEDEDANVNNLFGPHDLLGRENIVTVLKFNTGRHRMFNSIVVSGVEEGNAALQQDFGTRQKTVTLDFFTDTTKLSRIAKRLLREFKAPKIELTVRVATSFAKDFDILDRFSVNYPLRIGEPADGKFLPVIGAATIGDTDTPLPKQFGALQISDQTAFKVIEISHIPKSFLTDLKLRQVGVELNDGVFSTPDNCIIGFAVIGEAVICSGSTDPFNPSVVGAAKIGSTRVA